MIQVFLVKLIIGAIKDAIEKKKRIKGLNNLKRIDDYVNKDNVLDKQMKQVQKNLNKYGKYIEQLEKKVAELKKDSHPPLFKKRDKSNIEKRLTKLEKKEK